MPWDSLTTRADVAATIPEDVGAEIVKVADEMSAAMRFFRRISMPAAQTRFPVLSALPVVYWVNGDTGQKQTTEVAWTNKYINVEELASILPIPDAVAEDMEFNIWDRARPMLAEAISRQLDATIFFGDSASGLNFPTNVAAAAIAAGNTYTRGTSAAAIGGIAEDFNQVIGTVEADGFDVNGAITSRTYRRILRSARDTTGQKLLDVATGTLDDIPIQYSMRGLWPTGALAAEMFVGDWDQFVLGIRRDITFEIFKEGVVQDNTGAIVYNLMQQDMSALRVTFRVGWQVANPMTREQTVEANRYPAAILRAP